MKSKIFSGFYLWICYLKYGVFLGPELSIILQMYFVLASNNIIFTQVVVCSFLFKVIGNIILSNKMYDKIHLY